MPKPSPWQKQPVPTSVRRKIVDALAILEGLNQIADSMAGIDADIGKLELQLTSVIGIYPESATTKAALSSLSEAKRKLQQACEHILEIPNDLRRQGLIP